jgi:glutathione S-transferase
MKVYLDPISTTCRPIILFLAEHASPAELVPVRLFQGEHLTESYAAINPNKCVPTLVDGGFVLSESSAILKYLADKFSSPTYPKGLQERARVNAAMDWFNTGLYRDLGYGVVYQQVFPQYRFADPLVQESTLARNMDRAANWLRVLDTHYLGDADYVCGNAVTLADYLGSSYVTLAEWVDYDLSPYRSVTRWLERMKARPSWRDTHDEWNALVASFHTPAAKTA